MKTAYIKKFQRAHKFALPNPSTHSLFDPLKHSSKVQQMQGLLDSIAVPRKYRVQETIAHIIETHQERNPFYVVHLDNLEYQFERWMKLLPNVKPFYAIKSNPDRNILKVLREFGTGFDCASQKEIEEVLALGVSSKNIIFANPVKQVAHLEFAACVGVEVVTADSTSELVKIAQHHPEAKVLIRLKPDDSQSICKFSCKFGASEEEAREMIGLAARLGVNVIGTSFHVGSGCQSAQTFVDIIKTCSQIFKFGSIYGFKMTLLDIGGGFPGMNANHTGDSFETMASQISLSIKRHFKEFPDLEVIAEPGRYFSSSAFSLVTSVVGKKHFKTDSGEKGFKYYIDEGVYGGFNCIIFDHYSPPLEILNPRENADRYDSTVFGPTCDSMDKIGEMRLPELEIGDRLFVESFGAYTSTSSSVFNGFGNLRRYYTYKCDE